MEKMEFTFIQKLLLIGIFIIFQVVLTIGIVHLVVNGKSAKSEEKVNLPKTVEKNVQEEYFELGKYTVNLRDIDPRYLTAEIRILIENKKDNNYKKIVKEIENKKFVIDDKLNVLLRKKTVKELENDVDFTSIKKEIVKVINKELKTGKITKVFFGEFLYQ